MLGTKEKAEKSVSFQHTERDVLAMKPRRFYHEAYCVFSGTGKDRFSYLYDKGPIIRVASTSYNPDTGEPGVIDVLYRDKSHYSWKTQYAESVYQEQVGIAVSQDGGAVFLPTWYHGFHCLDARTGDRIWWKRYGVTNVFVLENTLVCQRPNKSLQLLDLHTGELLKERRVNAWGFISLNHRYLICETRISERCHQWEIIRAATLETVQTFYHKELTLSERHPHYSIVDIVWKEPGDLHVSGFTDKQVFSIGSGYQSEQFSTVIPCMDLSE